MPPQTPQTENTPPVEQQNTQLQEPLNSDPQINKPKKRNWLSKKMVLPISVAVLLIAGGAYALYNHTHKKTSVNVITTNTTTTTHQPAITKTLSYFYLAPDTKSISVYNPETKTKSAITISAGQDEELVGGSLGSNEPVQISVDGGVIAYSTGKQVNCGEGGCNITDTYIYIKVGDTAEQTVKLSQPQMLDDWLLSPDGKTIFYLINKDSSKSAGFDLHKFSLADKKDTLIKQNVFDTTSNVEKTQMYATDNNSFSIYNDQGGITEYTYKDGALKNRSLGVDKFCGDCRVETGEPLSPDGKTLILESGNTTSTFSYYSFDLTNSAHKQIVKTAKTTEQLLSVYWSPDGKSIAYEITANGSAGQNEVGFKFRFEIYDIASGKTTVGFTDPSPGVSDQNYSKHFVELLGWSPDSTYITFLNDDTVKLYKLTDASTLDTGITTQNPISSNIGFGWYYR